MGRHKRYHSSETQETTSDSGTYGSSYTETDTESSSESESESNTSYTQTDSYNTRSRQSKSYHGRSSNYSSKYNSKSSKHSKTSYSKSSKIRSQAKRNSSFSYVQSKKSENFNSYNLEKRPSQKLSSPPKKIKRHDSSHKKRKSSQDNYRYSSGNRSRQNSREIYSSSKYSHSSSKSQSPIKKSKLSGSNSYTYASPKASILKKRSSFENLVNSEDNSLEFHPPSSVHGKVSTHSVSLHTQSVHSAHSSSRINSLKSNYSKNSISKLHTSSSLTQKSSLIQKNSISKNLPGIKEHDRESRHSHEHTFSLEDNNLLRSNQHKFINRRHKSVDVSYSTGYANQARDLSPDKSQKSPLKKSKSSLKKIFSRSSSKKVSRDRDIDPNLEGNYQTIEHDLNYESPPTASISQTPSLVRNKSVTGSQFTEEGTATRIILSPDCVKRLTRSNSAVSLSSRRNSGRKLLVETTEINHSLHKKKQIQKHVTYSHQIFSYYEKFVLPTTFFVS